MKTKTRKKQTRSDILRKYGIPPNHKLRYESNIYKGIFWYWFARYVRMRDALKWGTCISCGKPKVYEELQAGHFASAGSCGFFLLFDERNVNGECGYCNGYDENHLWGYERNLDRRFGKGTAAKLKDRYQRYKCGETKKEWSTKQYIEKIEEYKLGFDELSPGW